MDKIKYFLTFKINQESQSIEMYQWAGFGQESVSLC